jgi:Flp pilus assembly protein TadG
MRSKARRRDDRGTALIEFTWLGILLLVPLVYILISVFDVQRGAFGVTAAARAAGRAYSLAETDTQGRADAEEVARLALADQGLEDAALDITVRCSPDPGNCLTAGSTITITVRTQVKLSLLPSVLGGGAPSFRVDATHSVPYGEFRESS